MSSKIVEVDDNNFEQQVLNNQHPVLLEFWASWSGPCISMQPVLKQFAQQHQGKVQVLRCNIDTTAQLPVKYGIRNVPTLLLFNNGAVLESLTGIRTIEQLNDLIANAL